MPQNKEKNFGIDLEFHTYCQFIKSRASCGYEAFSGSTKCSVWVLHMLDEIRLELRYFSTNLLSVLHSQKSDIFLLSCDMWLSFDMQKVSMFLILVRLV